MTTLEKHNPISKFKAEMRLLSSVQYEHLVAGMSGGLISTVVLHPFDLLKTRFAVHDGKGHSAPRYGGIANGFAIIIKQEGFFGLYRGVVANMWGSGFAWGFYFLFYNALKTYVRGDDPNKALTPTNHLIAASEAGVLSLLLTNPLWVIKTRLCLQYTTPPALLTGDTYNGMLDAFKKIYANEGIRGYYKGLGPGIVGVSHGAVQFTVYEELKTQYNLYRSMPVQSKLTTAEYLSFAAISKLIAVATTYPYQLVRARLQNQHYTYKGSWHCIRETWKYEGWTGFYKGLGINMLKVTPATMITFVVYENISYFLMKRRNKQISKESF